MVRCKLSSPCVRFRFTLAAVSFLGFVVFLLMVLLHPPPSTLLPNHPPPSPKISLILLPPASLNSSQITSFAQRTLRVLAEQHLQSELLVSMETSDFPESSVELLRDGKRHVEVLAPRPPYLVAALSQAFSHSHFSLLLVVGDFRFSVEHVLFELVDPVMKGSSDISIAHYQDESAMLGVLTYPLTHSTGSVGNSSLFCLHKEQWMKGCAPVSPHGASAVMELLAKCSFHSHSAITLPVPSSHTSWAAIGKQVLMLYVELHPFCVALFSLLLVCCVLVCARAGLKDNSKPRTLQLL